MGPATVVTLAGVAIIVAALAFYLITIAYTLRHVSFTVGTVLIGVRAIAQQCEPLAPVIRDLANEVTGIDRDLQGLLYGNEPPAKKAYAHSLPYGSKMYGPPQAGF